MRPGRRAGARRGRYRDRGRPASGCERPLAELDLELRALAVALDLDRDLSPGSSCATASARSSASSTACPSTFVITSPPSRERAGPGSASSPRAAAQPGLLGRAAGLTSCTHAPLSTSGRSARRAAGRARTDCDAEVGVARLAARRAAASSERLTTSIGHREADALAAAGARLDLLVDADHAAVGVDERAAGVAGVDRRVGLDRAGDLELGQRRRSRGRPPRRRRPTATGARRTASRSPPPARRPATLRARRRAAAGAASGPSGRS